MTTLIAVDTYFGNETRAKAVARRLRQEIAGIDISKSRAARICGVTQPWMSRRLTGATALAVDELDMICAKLGLSYDYIATGKREFVTPPPPGVPSLLLPRMDTAALPVVPESQPRPRPVTDTIWSELQELAGPRELLMARLACQAGLRRGEVARLHRNDLVEDVDGWSLIVHGKGGRQRVVPIKESLAESIRSYRSGYTPKGYLFPGYDDGHVSPNWVGKLLSDLMPTGWSMHKLRHRYASKGFAGTHNIRAVQEALGHASVATTQRYTAVTSSEVRAVSESAD